MPIKISEKIQDWWKLQCSKNGTMVQFVYASGLIVGYYIPKKFIVSTLWWNEFFFHFHFVLDFSMSQKQIQKRSTKWKTKKQNLCFLTPKEASKIWSTPLDIFFRNALIFGFESIVNWSGGSTSKCILNDDVFQKLGCLCFSLVKETF